MIIKVRCIERKLLNVCYRRSILPRAICSRFCCSLASTMNQSANIIAAINIDASMSQTDNSPHTLTHVFYSLSSNSTFRIRSISRVECARCFGLTFDALFFGEDIDYRRESFQAYTYETRVRDDSCQTHDGKGNFLILSP